MTKFSFPNEFMKIVQRVKVSLPDVSNFNVHAPASIRLRILRILAVWDVLEHPQWVFGHVRHGKGSWDAVGKIFWGKTVSMDTIDCSEIHAACHVCFRGRLIPPASLPPPFKSQIVYSAT